jgi:hypothetical protein
MNELNSANTGLDIAMETAILVLLLMHLYFSTQRRSRARTWSLLMSPETTGVCFVIKSKVYLYYHAPTKQYIDTADDGMVPRTYTQALKHYTKRIASSTADEQKTYEILKEQLIKHEQWVKQSPALTEQFKKGKP